MSIDLLAVMAHPDDAELLCGGALAKAADQGHSVGILDLTAGEGGSSGSVSLRATEANKARDILSVSVSQTAGLADSKLENTLAARDIVATILRELEPTVVILHWPDARHPDHRVAAELGRDACYAAGLGTGKRPGKVIYALAYQEAFVKPTFVVDISEQMDRKLEAIFAFDSQFGGGKTAMGDVMGGERPLREQIIHLHAYYGSLIRKKFGEPFWTKETMVIDDLVNVGVRSM